MKNTAFITHIKIVAALLFAASAYPNLQAQTAWTGAGADNNWSTVANWSSGVPGTSSNVTFDNTGTTTAGTVNSIVNSNTTIQQLLAKNTGATATDWHVLQINTGVTLKTTREVHIGNITVATATESVTTQMKLTGNGKFIMDSASRDFIVTNKNSVNNATNISSATLDASGLAQFEVWASNVKVGDGQGSLGILSLGQTSKIYAGTLTVGGNGNNGPVSAEANAVHMGGSTTLQVNTITIGKYRANGVLDFQSGLQGTPTVRILGRNTSVVERADMTVGWALNHQLDTPLEGTVDFTGGTVDAFINNLVVGTAARENRYNPTGGGLEGAGGGVTAIVSMDAGTIDANAVILGQSTSDKGTARAALASGTLTVNGGTFKAGSMTLGQSAGQAATGIVNIGGTGASVEVTGDIEMGSQSGLDTAATYGGTVVGVGAATATINLSSGTLKVGGNITKGSDASVAGSVVSTINLGGGTLDLTDGSGSITVDNFNFTGGTLKNVTAFSATGMGGLVLQNTATLAFDLDAAFTTLALTGALDLSDGNANLSLALADDFAPVANFILIANDASDSITGTFATINGGAFGSGNMFTLTNNTGTYEFSLNYAGGDGNDLVLSLTSVPEPALCAIFAGLGMLAFVLWRRRR